MTIYYDNQYVIPRLTQILPDLIGSYTTNLITHIITTNYVAYSFATNTSFYDYRETDTVKALEIDVNKFRIWLTNSASPRGGKYYNTLNSNGSTSKGHGINSVYVYNNIPFSSTQLPAVRLVNGVRLPASGLTMATPQPLYVKGDYNTTTNGTTFATTLGSTTNGFTFPAALMGDAITVLSANWSDAYTSPTSLASRTASSITTINAAVLEGIVQSVTDSGGTKHYSGGMENFSAYVGELERGHSSLQWFRRRHVSQPIRHQLLDQSGNLLQSANP